MAALFLKILNMSISASWMVLAVLLARFCLKKAPKWISVLLWALVGLRLICPFSIQSAFSLIPNAQTIPAEIMMDHTPAIQTGVPALDSAVNPVISQSFTPSPGASANPLQIWIPVGANLWLLGVAVMLVYAAISYLRLKLRNREATLYKENIYFSDHAAPFVLGIFKPMIYLPYQIGEGELEYVIAHEKAHIQRKDHWWKPLGFLVLSLHWLNPVVWLAYILFCRDIELACDEKVVKDLSSAQRADYSSALLACGTGHGRVSPCPLAFGEGSLKLRVKAVLYYKKPTLWVLILALVLCAAIALCCLTDPGSQPGSFDPYTIPVFSFDLEAWENRGDQIKSKLDMPQDSVFRITETDGIMYYRGTQSAPIPGVINDEEAVAKAENYLEQLGLLPQDAYRTRVIYQYRSGMISSGAGAQKTEVVSIRVFFYRVYRGTDVVTDRNDGITLWFDGQGLYSLQYLWRELHPGELPKTEKPITAEKARQIYIDYMSAAHTDHWDASQELTLQQVYASFDEQMRPCWQISQGEAYENPVYIDMFTGKILYA